MKESKWVVLNPDIGGTPRVAHRIRWPGQTHCGVEIIAADDEYDTKPPRLKSCRRCKERAASRRRKGIE